MATLYFQLERSKTDKNKCHPIYLVLKIVENGKERRFRYYTGRSALSKHWIGKGESKKVSAKAPGSGITNDRLETLRLGADAIIMNAKNMKIALTVDYFKQRFGTEVLGLQKDRHQEPLQGLIDRLGEFINSKANIFQPATIKTYVTLRKSLIEFENSTGYKLSFESMNQNFYSLYTKYLIEETQVINNTVAKRFATLRAFLSEMKRLKVNTNADFEYFNASRNYDTTLMYLTETELQNMQEVLLEDGTLSHVRDVFCFACHTGLRFSDWGRLTPANLVTSDHGTHRIKALKFTMFKVHKEVVVPLSDYALSIIEKYSDQANKTGKLFPVYTNQETNRSLKTIAKFARINDIIMEEKKSGAKRITSTNPKHEVLTCHDARNTMATLYLERGGRPEVLKQLLGHSDIKQTMRYVKITEKAVLIDHLKLKHNDSAKVVSMMNGAN